MRDALHWLLPIVIGLTMWLGRHPIEPPAPPAIADPPAVQQQINQLLPMLNSTDAERVMGSYVPDVGATFAVDLIRGANGATDRPPEEAVRDWGIYLMQTFGSQVTVADDEVILFAIRFYDYRANRFRDLSLTSPSGQTADPSQYAIWLDNQPFGGTAR